MHIRVRYYHAINIINEKKKKYHKQKPLDSAKSKIQWQSFGIPNHLLLFYLFERQNGF